MKLYSIIKKYYFYIFCLVFFISLSYVGRHPVYGKLKFLTLNAFHYTDAIPYKISNAITPKKFSTDNYTQKLLLGLLGVNILVYEQFVNYQKDYFNESLELSMLTREVNCLVNLKGFPDTWVPSLTGHWRPIMSNTARLYEYKGYTGKKLNIILKNIFPRRCIILADEEIPWEQEENFRYHSPNLNYTVQQQDIHILQFRKPGGEKHNILIDTGMRPQTLEKLLDYLAMNEIFHIDEVFITHPHKDHYSGLFELINFGIPIKKVWMNFPDKKKCDSEIPWGCDYQDLLKLQRLMNENKIQFQELIHTKPNEPVVVYEDSNNTLSVIFASSPFLPEIGMVDINDMSMLMKLKTNGVTYLFTGDLNNPLSNVLKGNEIFRADILKIPHHGAEGVASNEFFDTVNAKIGIVPSPAGLWCTDRSARVRNYFRKSKARMYISALHGDIMFRHFKNGKYLVTTELETGKICE